MYQNHGVLPRTYAAHRCAANRQSHQRNKTMRHRKTCAGDTRNLHKEDRDDFARSDRHRLRNNRHAHRQPKYRRHNSARRYGFPRWLGRTRCTTHRCGCPTLQAKQVDDAPPTIRRTADGRSKRSAVDNEDARTSPHRDQKIASFTSPSSCTQTAPDDWLTMCASLSRAALGTPQQYRPILRCPGPDAVANRW